MDRTELILEIFARAQHREGKLQVELAQLEHLSTRLVRGWTSSSASAAGWARPAARREAALELDRRYIASARRAL